MSGVGGCGCGRGEQGIRMEQKTWALQSFVAGPQVVAGGLGGPGPLPLPQGSGVARVNSPTQLSRRALVSASVQWASPCTSSWC